MNTALLLVDFQYDYFPGGAVEVVGSVEAAGRAQGLLEACRRKTLPVIHVQHISVRPGAAYLLPGTKGSEIHESVAPRAGEPVVQKHFPNSFRETSLLEHLRENRISRLIIAGMMTYMCIDSTTRAAADLGFECSLAHDACATRSLSFNGVAVPAASVHAAFIAGLNGLFAKVLSVDEIVAHL
jgi:nicotinamidase-related amidase